MSPFGFHRVERKSAFRGKVPKWSERSKNREREFVDSKYFSFLCCRCGVEIHFRILASNPPFCFRRNTGRGGLGKTKLSPRSERDQNLNRPSPPQVLFSPKTLFGWGRGGRGNKESTEMGKEGEGLYSLCVVFFSLAFFPVLFWRTEREIFLPQDPRKKGRVKRAEKSLGFIALRRLREIYGRGCLPPLFGHTKRDQTFCFLCMYGILLCVYSRRI